MKLIRLNFQLQLFFRNGKVAMNSLSTLTRIRFIEISFDLFGRQSICKITHRSIWSVLFARICLKNTQNHRLIDTPADNQFYRSTERGIVAGSHLKLNTFRQTITYPQVNTQFIALNSLQTWLPNNIKQSIIVSPSTHYLSSFCLIIIRDWNLSVEIIRFVS